MTRYPLLFLFVPLTAACGAAHPSAGTFGDGGHGQDSGFAFGGDDGGMVLGGGDGGTPPGTPGCSDEAKLVYVVSHEGALYSFYPPTLTFTPIGQVACPTGGAFPFSMAVDREGTAWVLHSDGSVWQVSTKDASCRTAGYQANQAGFHLFGMGFATADATSTTDTLYVSDFDGKGLGILDVATKKLTPVGPYDGALRGRNSELTGTGDGRLFGFFTTSPAQVAEITKATGAIASNQPLQNVTTGTDWAFSFWGGDFYLYTAQVGSGLPSSGSGSDVTRYRPSDKSVTVVKTNVGFRIVGAGVSTCAPTVPVAPR